MLLLMLIIVDAKLIPVCMILAVTVCRFYRLSRTVVGNLITEFSAIFYNSRFFF